MTDSVANNVSIWVKGLGSPDRDILVWDLVKWIGESGIQATIRSSGSDLHLNFQKTEDATMFRIHFSELIQTTSELKRKYVDEATKKFERYLFIKNP